jgi:hypothetical protein
VNFSATFVLPERAELPGQESLSAIVEPPEISSENADGAASEAAPRLVTWKCQLGHDFYVSVSY